VIPDFLSVGSCLTTYFKIQLKGSGCVTDFFTLQGFSEKFLGDNLNVMSLNKWGKSSKTSFESKLEILAQLSSAAKEDDELTDEFMEFVSFNDIGLPLAYLANEGLCDLNEEGTKYVSETWTLLLKLCEVEDMGFESLEDILKLS
jgi:hypothetical protein